MSSTRSKLIQINEYLLLEFEYNTERHKIEDTGAILVKDERVGWNYFLNGNQSGDITFNVLDKSCVRLTANTWVSTDIDVATQWIDYDVQMVKSNLTSYNRDTFYDTIKVHVLSGFNLESIEGLIFEIAVTDSNKKTLILSSQVFQKTNWSEFQFHSKPIFLGDRFYDKYLTWQIPSLKDLNREWAETDGNNTSISYQITNGMGIPSDSLLDIAIHEISKRSVQNNTFEIFEGGKVWRTSINQEDTYHLFSAVIEPSTYGDFFQFYPQYDNTFISEWINEMRTIGGDWIVIHDIAIWEQIEGEEFMTTSFSSFQENDFDIPHYFRPIVLNDNAFSFTLEYTCRIFNRKDQSQIIRRATYSSTDARMWGRNLDKIEIIGDNLKIYNKIVQSNPIKLNPVKEITKVQNIYFPQFIQNNNLVVSGQKVWLDKDNLLQATPDEFSTTLWPQGELKIFLSPFDNMFKFKIYDNS